ncbi:MAG: tetratricopeptide repeat protein [Thermodesulfobacteriota bacterium]
MADSIRTRRVLLPAVILLLLVSGVYARTLSQGFVSFDDLGYVIQNPTVQAGLTEKSLPYAFSFTDVSYFQPLALLSHMLDWELYGYRPGLHHLTSVLLHFFCSFLFFLVLLQYTGSFYRSLAAAALFAVHPMNVDTAAWVAERKNLLSTFFWLLAMLFYGRYVKKPSVGRYVPVFLSMLLGLLAKPVLMTLPCALLVMDWWPLCRMRFSPRRACQSPLAAGKLGLGRLFAEKLPLFFLTAASMAVSLLSLVHFKVNVSAAHSLSYRIENALVSYVKYMGKFLWPENMSVVYPYPKAIPGQDIFISATIIFFLLLFAWWFRRSRPCFLAGLLWFLGVLFPMTGIVQAGLWPAMADRFVYVPYMGLFMALCWFLPEALAGWRHAQAFLRAAAVCAVAVLAVLAYVQAGHWKSSHDLFTHAVAVTRDNAVAENNLGIALNEMGQGAEAIAHFRLAWAADQGYDEVAVNLGNALTRAGKCEEAVNWYERAARLRPQRALTYANLAAAWHCRQEDTKAMDAMVRAAELEPANAGFFQGLGILLLAQGRFAEAAAVLEKSLSLNPENPASRTLQAQAEGKAQGAAREALRLSAALMQNPENGSVRNDLAVRLVQAGRLDEAGRELSEALASNPENPQLKANLDAVSGFSNSKKRIERLLAK